MSATSPTTSAAPPSTGEVDPRGQRFAAALTSVVLLLALVAAPSVLTTVLLVAQAAAFLNAGFGFCLGCEMYLLLRRVAPSS